MSFQSVGSISRRAYGEICAVLTVGGRVEQEWGPAFLAGGNYEKGDPSSEQPLWPGASLYNGAPHLSNRWHLQRPIPRRNPEHQQLYRDRQTWFIPAREGYHRDPEQPEDEIR